MLFYEVLILFWGCAKTCTHARWFENCIIFLTDTNDSISSGFDEGPPSEKRNVLWLVSCPSALWLANSLDGVSVLPRPLPKQQVHQYRHINSDLENIEQEDRAEPFNVFTVILIK